MHYCHGLAGITAARGAALRLTGLKQDSRSWWRRTMENELQADSNANILKRKKKKKQHAKSQAKKKNNANKHQQDSNHAKTKNSVEVENSNIILNADA